MRVFLSFLHEILVGSIAISQLFFWEASLSAGLMPLSILMGIVVYRQEFEKNICSKDMLTDSAKGVLKKPSVLILLISLLICWNRSLFSILGFVSSMALVISLASFSFLPFRKLRRIEEKSVAVFIAATTLITGWVFPSILKSSLFTSGYLPSFWLLQIASGDLTAFLLVVVLSLWLIRIRYRFGKKG
ncbi:hypothetical protein DS67_02600 [Mesotoga sp. SC_4PWA21]|nr:hypothetical protein DS67_02600 [Mesotoga sp. SC_4PWA21]